MLTDEHNSEAKKVWDYLVCYPGGGSAKTIARDTGVKLWTVRAYLRHFARCGAVRTREVEFGRQIYVYYIVEGVTARPRFS